MDHKPKWESTILMDIYDVGGVTTIPYPSFTIIINIVSRRKAPNELQYVKSHTTCALISVKCPPRFCERKGNGRTANTFTMCSNFYARWDTITISSFTLQCTPISRSYNYLGLPILLCTSSYVSVVCTPMFQYVCTNMFTLLF